MNPQPHHALRAAAALAFNVPGLGVNLRYRTVGIDALIAPSSSHDARMHPSDLREVLSTEAIFDAAESLADYLGAPVASVPDPELVCLTPGVRDLPGGIIEIAYDPPKYAFATFMEASQVIEIASGAQTMPDEVSIREVPRPEDQENIDVMQIRPVRDEALGVTIVIVESYDNTPFGMGRFLLPIVQSIAAACAVAELTSGDELL